MEAPLVEMVKRLKEGEGYTAKFAAMHLIPTLYPFITTANQQALMQ